MSARHRNRHHVPRPGSHPGSPSPEAVRLDPSLEPEPPAERVPAFALVGGWPQEAAERVDEEIPEAAAEAQQGFGAERSRPSRQVRQRPVGLPDELPEAAAEEASGRKAACTAAQLRRFIKSRPYVPIHELRRRFAIEGLDDEVGSFRTDEGTFYVGLPQEEAALLGELVRAGDVGCEMLLDPRSPAVIGVFPMRPVARA